MKTTTEEGISEEILAEVQKEVNIVSAMNHDFIVNIKAVGRGLYDK